MIANPFDYSNIKNSISPQEENKSSIKTDITVSPESQPNYFKLESELKQVKEDNKKLTELLSFYTSENPEDYLRELTSPIFKNLSDINISLSQKNEKLEEANHDLKIQLERSDKKVVCYKERILELRKQNKKLQQTVTDESFNIKLLEELSKILASSEEMVILKEPLLGQLREAVTLALNSEDESEEVGAQDNTKIEELVKERENILVERRDYNQKENEKIQELESVLNQSDYQKLHEEQSQKYQQDKFYSQEVHKIDEKIDAITGEAYAHEQNALLEAIDNTVKETNRKHDRSSETSSTPSSQQGLDKANTDSTQTGKKRGAPKGKNGYRFEIDGLNLSEIDQEKLEELLDKFPVEIVNLFPKNVPLDAQFRLKSSRIGFGMIKSPCIFLYNQHEAVWKDPDNKRKLIKQEASYPEWLKKTFSYSPDYHIEALTLRIQLKSSYGKIAQYFNEGYGFPITPMTVWQWVHRAASQAEVAADRIKKELTQEEYLGADETGIRDLGKTKWMNATTSDNWTLFNVSDSRDFKGLEDNGILLNAAEGTVVVRDGYKIYDDEKLDHLIFNRCWAHKTRSAEQILKFEDPYNQDILRLLEWFRQALKERNQALEQGRDKLEPKVFERLSQAYDSIVEDGLKNCQQKKVLFKNLVKHPVIRKQMKNLLTRKATLFDFLKGKPPYQTPWAGYSLSGRKNPEIIVELFKIINEIDKVVALANRDEKVIPLSQQEQLKKEFFDLVEKIYEEYKDSSAKMNIKTPPQLSEETTQTYLFFKDLKEDRNAFLNFIKDLNSKVSNNDTERSIRAVKLMMKVAGSFRGYSQEYANLESYISSAKKQKLNIYDSLAELVNKNPDYLFDKKSTVNNLNKPKINTVPVKKKNKKDT